MCEVCYAYNTEHSTPALIPPTREGQNGKAKAMDNIEYRTKGDMLILTIDTSEVIGKTGAGNKKIAETQRFERIKGTNYSLMMMLVETPERVKNREDGKAENKNKNKTRRNRQEEEAPEPRKTSRNNKPGNGDKNKTKAKAKPPVVEDDEEPAPRKPSSKNAANKNKSGKTGSGNKNKTSRRPSRSAAAMSDMSDI